MYDCDRAAANGDSSVLEVWDGNSGADGAFRADNVARLADSLGRPAGGLAPGQALLLRGHIDARLEASIRVRDLASLSRLSRSHFSRAFRNSFGQTPHRYIMRRRLERACALMLTMDVSLEQIAAECGLVDRSHFSRLFRQSFGQSPGAWRQATRLLKSREKVPGVP